MQIQTYIKDFVIRKKKHFLELLTRSNKQWTIYPLLNKTKEKTEGHIARLQSPMISDTENA